MCIEHFLAVFATISHDYIYIYICISLHLNQTKDGRNVTENSFKVDYHHISLSQEMHYFRIRKMCKISKTCNIICAKA